MLGFRVVRRKIENVAPHEAAFGFWPPFFDEAKAGDSFLFFSSPEGQLPRRGILVIGAGPNIGAGRPSAN